MYLFLLFRICLSASQEKREPTGTEIKNAVCGLLRDFLGQMAPYYDENGEPTKDNYFEPDYKINKTSDSANPVKTAQNLPDVKQDQNKKEKLKNLFSLKLNKKSDSNDVNDSEKDIVDSPVEDYKEQEEILQTEYKTKEQENLGILNTSVSE